MKIMLLILLLLALFMSLYIHEIGHALVMNRCKLKVELIQIGIGPMLFQFNQQDILIRIHLFPTCALIKHSAQAFEALPLIKRLAIDVAGLFFNAGVAMVGMVFLHQTIHLPWSFLLHPLQLFSYFLLTFEGVGLAYFGWYFVFLSVSLNSALCFYNSLPLPLLDGWEVIHEFVRWIPDRSLRLLLLFCCSGVVLFVRIGATLRQVLGLAIILVGLLWCVSLVNLIRERKKLP